MQKQESATYPQPRTFDNPRDQKAEDLKEVFGAIRSNADGSFTVTSQWTPGKSYNVTLGVSPACECADFAYRRATCKHILAARSFNEAI